MESKFDGIEPFGLTRAQGIYLDETITSLPQRKWDAGAESINEAAKKEVENLTLQRQQNETSGRSSRASIVRYLDALDDYATNDSIAAHLDAQGIVIERASLNWALTNLVSDRKISRIRRGQYSSNQYLRGLREIAEDELEVDDPEPQKTIAVQFDYDDDGKVSVDAIAGSDRLRDDADARERHAEVRRVALNLMTSFDASLPGANSASELIAEVSSYITSLGETPKEIRPSLLIMRGDGLRNYLQMQNHPSEMSDIPPLSDSYLLNLRRLVAAHNLMVGVDPQLAARDEALLGPDERAFSISPSVGKRILHDAVVSRVATAEAEIVLVLEGANVGAGATPKERIARRYSEGVRNFARAVIASAAATARFVWRHRRGVLAGTVALPPSGIVIARWMVANETWFTNMFGDNPHMLTVVRDVIEALHNLPIL